MGDPLVYFTAGDKALADDLNNNFQKAKDGYNELITGEAINTTSAPIPIYIDSNGHAMKCDANDTARLRFDGFAVAGQNISSGGYIQVILIDGVIVGGFTGLTRGSKYYVQDAVGTIGTTPGTYIIPVGRANSATEIVILKTPEVASGIMTPVDSQIDATIDRTITCGFSPKIIKLNFWLQGHTAGSGTNTHNVQAGYAVFTGTTLTYRFVLGTSGGAADSLPATIFSVSGPDTSAVSVGENSADAGAIIITITISSITATGFVIRATILTGASPTCSYHARANISWEAFE